MKTTTLKAKPKLTYTISIAEALILMRHHRAEARGSIKCALTFRLRGKAEEANNFIKLARMEGRRARHWADQLGIHLGRQACPVQAA